MNKIMHLEMVSDNVLNNVIARCHQTAGYFAVIVRDYTLHWPDDLSPTFTGNVDFRGTSLGCNRFYIGQHFGEFIAEYENGSRIIFAKEESGFTMSSDELPEIFVIDTQNTFQSMNDILDSVRNMINLSQGVYDNMLAFHEWTGELSVFSPSASRITKDCGWTGNELEEYLDSLGGEAVG